MSATNAIAPTYRGHISSTRDALLIFEGCLQGLLNHSSRPPWPIEHANVVVSGNIFVYEEQSSGITSWDDGMEWDAPRVAGNFITYRQRAGSSNRVCNGGTGAGGASTSSFGMRTTTDPNGDTIEQSQDMYKTTLSVTMRGLTHHLISYISMRDINAYGSSYRSDLRHLIPRAELLNQGFLAPLEMTIW